MGKRNRNRADDKASISGPTHRKQRKEAPWIAKLNDELTLCTVDLTANKEDYNESLDPAAHLIHHPSLVIITLTLRQYILLRGEKRRMLTTFLMIMILSVSLITTSHLE